MTIDLDVAAEARHFGLDPALIQAVVIAEGDIVKAVQCSIPTVTTREQAIEITCRSAVHAMLDFILTNDLMDGASLKDEFVKFWAKRWAPQGAKNDPTNLNRFWASNVLNHWTAV
jgi:hypothetical protein